ETWHIEPVSFNLNQRLTVEYSDTLLGDGPRSGGLLQRQNYSKRRALTHGAGDVNAAVVVFDDAAGERQAQAGTVALGGVERPEDVGEVLRRNAAAIVGHFHRGHRSLGFHGHP